MYFFPYDNFKKVKNLLGTKKTLLLYKSNILPYYDLVDIFYDIANVDQVLSLQKSKYGSSFIFKAIKFWNNLPDIVTYFVTWL